MLKKSLIEVGLILILNFSITLLYNFINDTPVS